MRTGMRGLAIGVFTVFILSLPLIALWAQENITITTYYPSPFGSYLELTWGDLPNRSRGILQANQGASIELGGLNALGGPATPYIDFHNDMVPFPVGDFDARIILLGNDALVIDGVATGATGSSPAFVAGRAHIPGCVRRTYTAASGITPCPAGFTVTSTGPVAAAGAFLCCQFQ